MSADNFPQEIVDHIVKLALLPDVDASETSQISAETKQIQRELTTSCILISPSFSHPARRHRFSVLDLFPYDSVVIRTGKLDEKAGKKRMVDLISILQYSGSLPPVILFVKEIILKVDPVCRCNTLKDELEVHRAIRALNTFPSHVETLRIGGISGSWDDIGPLTRSALMELSQNPSINSMCVHDIECLPISFFQDCPSLRSLEFLRVTLSPSVPPPMTSQKHLDFLYLIGHEDLTRSFIREGDFQITFSRCKMYPIEKEDAVAAWSLIQRSSQVLETLELMFDADTVPDLRFICLSHLPSLKTVRVFLENEYGMEKMIYRQAQRLFVLLCPTEGVTNITKIEISFEYRVNNLPYNYLSLLGKKQYWKPLFPSNLLAIHPMLNFLGIHIDLSEYDRPSSTPRMATYRKSLASSLYSFLSPEQSQLEGESGSYIVDIEVPTGGK